MPRKINQFLFVLAGMLAGGCQQTAEVGASFNAPCSKVVSLGPTVTELLLAMGQEEKLVAVSRYDHLPAGLSRPSVGGLLDPEIEAIVALKPDCLFYVPAGPTMSGRLAPLQNFGIRVKAIEAPSLTSLPAAAEKLGKLLQEPAAAAGLQQQFKAQKQRLSAATAPKGQPLKVVIVYDNNPLIVAGAGSLGDEFIRQSGWINPITAANYPIIDEEYLASLDLDLLLDLGQYERQSYYQQLFKKAPRIIRLDNEYLRHPSPDSWKNWSDFVEELLKTGNSQQRE